MASLLAAMLSTAAVRVEVAPERSQAFVIEGDEALEQGDYEEAINKYRAAYYGLSASQRISYLGSLPVRNAMRAYDLLRAGAPDQATLQQQLGFLTEFLAGVEARDDGVERVGADVVAELQRIREDLERELAARPEESGAGRPGGQPEPPEPPRESARMDELDDALTVVEEPADEESAAMEASAGDPAEDGDRTRTRDWLGIGLAIGGGAIMGVGTGVMVGRWTIRRQALTKADQTDWPSAAYRTAYLDGQDLRAQRFLIAGIVVLGVGTATLTAGVVHILMWRRARPETATLRVYPQLGTKTLGFGLSGRF